MRKNCTKEKSRCRATITLYEYTCKICKENGVVRKNVGETSRSTFLRGTEHVSDLVGEKETSHMLQHLQDTHQDLVGTLKKSAQTVEVFDMKAVRKNTTCLNRQINEAIRVIRAGGTAINNKEEYSRYTLPIIKVTRGPQLSQSNPDLNKSKSQLAPATGEKDQGHDLRL